MTSELECQLDDLERNDAAGAERIARAIAAELGELPPVVRHYLWMLQDDPSDFERRIADRGGGPSSPARLSEAE